MLEGIENTWIYHLKGDRIGVKGDRIGVKGV